MLPLSPGRVTAVASRLIADRRRGVDQRIAARRQTFKRVSLDRRQAVDRRRGTERRSTLERRGRVGRGPAVESPREHLRNALQLLSSLRGANGLDGELRGDLVAALQRLERVLQMLEGRAVEVPPAG